jgi:hypothetical protein
MGLLTAAARAGVEGFSSIGGSEYKRQAYMDFTSMVISFVIAVVILGFVGKLLWNGVIVDMVSFAKPVRSVWQILGLMVFVSLIHS